VAGTTRSSNFPTTPGAYQTTINAGNNDLFILKLSADGSSLVYSTFLGGSGFDEGTSIAIDPSGNAYVTGTTYSSNFPTTPGAYNRTIQGVQNDAFALKLSSNGSSLVYSTYIGGTLGDYGNAITLDSSGFVYITGETTSTNFPTSPGAYQTTNKGSYEVFIFKLNSDMSSLVYSTYIGGGGTDSSKAIVVDTSGNAYVTGSTTSVNFPTTLGAYQTTRKSTIDAFVSKLSSNGSSLVYSTYIGGTGSEYGNGINVDSSGNAYMTGYTGSSNFPTTTGAYQATNGGSNDVFVLRLNSTGSKIIYSTLIGGSSADYGCGIAIDSYACAHLTGYTASTNFPTTPGANQTANMGSYDAFVLDIPCYTVPLAPTLNALAGNTQASLSWNVPDDMGANIDYYLVYQDGVEVANLTTNSTVVTDLINGQSYSFTVSAHNAAGLGQLSNAAACIPYTIPDAPTLDAVAGDAQVVLTWTAPSDNGRTIDYYLIYQEGAEIVNLTNTSATITGLTNGLSYPFTVVAHNQGGLSAESNVAIVVPFTVPGAPTNLVAVPGNAQVMLSWTAPNNNGRTIDYYLVYNQDTGLEVDNVTAASATISGLTNGLQYNFTVYAHNEGGLSAESNTATATPYTVPNAPTITSAIAGNDQVTLTWTVPYNGGTTIDYYLVYQDGVALPTHYIATTTTITGLSNGVSYSFAVSAVTVAGEGEKSSIVSAIPFTVPDAPTNLVATPGNGLASLTWTVPNDNGRTIDYYLVYQDGVEVANVATTSTTVTGLVNGQSYSFTVAAHNAAGLGTQSSAAVSVPYTIPDAPVLNAVGCNAQVSLSWNAPADNGAAIDYYLVYQDCVEVANVTTTLTTITGLTNGESYSFTVVAHNAAGLGPLSEAVESVPYDPDQTLPCIEILNPTGGTNNTGIIIVTWFGSDPSGIDQYDLMIFDGAAWVNYTGLPSTTTSKTIDLDDGTYTIYVRAIDCAGNKNMTHSHVNVDTIAPTVTVTPTGNDVAINATIVVIFSETMDTSTVVLVVNGVAVMITWNGNVATFVPAAVLEYNRTYAVTVTGKDLAGNEVTHPWLFKTVRNVGNIVGTVVDNDDKPIANVTVMLNNGMTTTTDENGHFWFENVTSGQYMVTVSKPTYTTVSKDVNITVGETTEITLTSVREENIPNAWLGWWVLLVCLAILALALLTLRLRRRKEQ
jgi:hypothetical protein